MPYGYSLELQAAVKAALLGDAGVSALVGDRVYLSPPQSAQRPFVGIGGVEVRPLRSDCGRAANITFSVEAHSRSVSSRFEATAVAEAIEAALNDAALTVDGFDLVFLHWQGQTVEPDKDGEGHLAIAAFTTLLDG